MMKDPERISILGIEIVPDEEFSCPFFDEGSCDGTNGDDECLECLVCNKHR